MPDIETEDRVISRNVVRYSLQELDEMVKRDAVSAVGVGGDEVQVRWTSEGAEVEVIVDRGVVR